MSVFNPYRTLNCCKILSNAYLLSGTISRRGQPGQTIGRGVGQSCRSIRAGTSLAVQGVALGWQSCSDIC